MEIPEEVIIDISQLFYRSVWPHGGKVPDLVETVKDLLTSNYATVPHTILTFDKHKSSAKDHERVRRSEDPIDEYDLTLLGALDR